jgi:branched-chain amino acid transport system ATP-binding protein
MLLRLEGLGAGWGEARILHDITLEIAEGEAIALLGRNGAGKTTLISALMGVARQQAGQVTLAGTVLDRLPPERRAALGLGWVPQERNIFRSLTVEENLTAVARPGPWNLARAWEFFPRLEQRRSNLGSALSGGEQQMLAMARALCIEPKLMLLDEPTEGLMPSMIAKIRDSVRELKSQGVATLLVEQRVEAVLPVADRVAFIETGRVRAVMNVAELRKDASALHRYVGVA